MIRWMCDDKDRVPSRETRARLEVEDIILVLQQNRLRWYRHVLRKEDIDLVKKCMEYEVEVPDPERDQKRTWCKKTVKQGGCYGL